MDKPTKASEVTQDIIEAWKKEYKRVFCITVEDKKGYYKMPDRRILSAAMKFGNNDPMKFNETIAKNCWLGGDEELQKEDAYFIGAAAKFGDLVEVKESEIKEL